MRYRILVCNSSACEEYSDQRCKWRVKKERRVLLRIPPHRLQFTQEAEAYSWYEATGNAANRPAHEADRIRHDILDRYEPARGSAPTLTQVQNFISNHKRTKLNGTNLVEGMHNLASRLSFTRTCLMVILFFFGFDVGEAGMPPQRTSIQFLLGEEEQEDAVYISQCEEETPELNLSLGWKKLSRELKTQNQNRMELQGQPLQG
ncbi:hypothetical protein GQ600_18810 [Phytophthora cactorum]|nr:hypothetical protein GQ600_18810 [Phytophthora cactorum]